MFVKIKPMKGISRFGWGGKLSPRCTWLLLIVERMSNLTYKLAVRTKLLEVHNNFHKEMDSRIIVDDLLYNDCITIRFDLCFRIKIFFEI